MYRELETNGAEPPIFHTNDFILKITVYKALGNQEKLTEKKKAILSLITENPYITKSELAKEIGISVAAVSYNIKSMRGKYLRRIGSDKGGFWEMIK